MANHCVARVPWKPDPAVAELWAKACMGAGFGSAFVPSPEFGDGTFSFECPDFPMFEPCVWMSAPRTVELRRGHEWLASRAADFLIEAIGRGFGALWQDDEGIGEFPIKEPAPLDFDGPTWLARGSNKPATGKPRYDGIHGEHLGSIPREKLGPPGPIHWTARLDWAARVEERFGGSMTASQAASAALPACAHGLPIPAAALKAIGQEGAQRALAVAMAWGSKAAAESLREACAGLDGAAAAEWARSKTRKAFANDNGGRDGPASLARRLAAIEALAEAWELGGVAGPAKAGRGRSPRV